MIQGLFLFDTAVGTCGLVWGAQGLLAVALPPLGASDPRAKLARRFPEAVETTPPLAVQAAVEAMQALLRGERLDLMDIVLDTQGVAPFNLRVYEIARAIPPGKTRTYGEIARELGDVAVSRAVGQALGANPWPIVVPCHRVLAAGGGKGGFSAPGGTDTKMRILEIEGALAPETLPLFGGL
ncbi:methylated-DNA--[protein]-cysteine S-methyltransferase [Phenylobacterium sp.]|uniref:methylated-DNA--[protein]-cysteine S-methyltransferase n=1 Tax=Phenylobacterium sp. TaxID=1871053 RepID=UPI00286BC17A|nr:methylated-DNA--[protein]-cysteine S-methyltransferase [Phenylobacterium sp.]